MSDEDPSQVSHNRHDGKWHPEHNGCRGDISDLQCSLIGGKFVDNLKICYNDICPENKTYTLCVINFDLIAENNMSENIATTFLQYPSMSNIKGCGNLVHTSPTP